MVVDATIQRHSSQNCLIFQLWPFKVNLFAIKYFNPRRADGLDFPWSAGGGGDFTPPPPSNSAPGLRSDMQQAAFESSSQIIKEVFQSFLRSGKRSGHQRSSKLKCSRFSTISTIFNFRRSSSWTRRARAARNKANDNQFTALPGVRHQISPQVNGLTSKGQKYKKIYNFSSNSFLSITSDNVARTKMKWNFSHWRIMGRSQNWPDLRS